jgi:hypothetical protein
VSIVRVGLSETKRFASGYDAIFGKKARTGTISTPRKTAKKKPTKKK